MSETNPYEPPRETSRVPRQLPRSRLSEYVKDRIALVATAIVVFLVVWCSLMFAMMVR